MINGLLALIARLTVGKQLLAGVAWLHNKLDGNRSEIATGILALVYVLKIAKILPADTANGIEAALAAILPVTLADKVSKAKALLDKVAPVIADAPVEPPKPN